MSETSEKGGSDDMTEKELEVREKQELQGEQTRPGPVFRPDTDILERSDGYVLYADLPGVDEGSVDVRFDRGVLTIDAGLATLPSDDWRPLHTEYRLGRYHREVKVSDEIDVSRVGAKMRHRGRELHPHESAEPGPRNIPIQAG